MRNSKILLFHNIATSYYKNIVFNEFYKIHKNFKVIHLAETEKIRDWKIDISDIEYLYAILAKGRLEDHSKIKMIKNIISILNEEDPDIVYLGGYYHIEYWIVLFWAKIKQRKIILEMDSNKFDHKRVYLKELIKKVFVSFIDIGITYGKLSMEYFKELGLDENKIVIKPNVTSKKLFHISQNKITFKKKNNFIYVGRFSEEKNLIRLLEAFSDATTQSKTNDWGLILIGSGNQEDELNSFINSNNIENVEIIGFVDKYDLSKYYNSATVFILPSISEPWGLVANEAMACAKPVLISSQCGCSLDLVYENGYIFNPWNKNELVELLISYMKGNEDIEKQSIKSKEIIEHFTPQYAAKQILEAVVKCEEL